MENSSGDSSKKRSSDESKSLFDGETPEKRPRLESEDSVSDIVKEGTGMSAINSEIREQDGHSPTEVIYELSPVHDESLLSIQEGKNLTPGQSPSRSEENEESDQNEDMTNKEEIEENAEVQEGNSVESNSGESDSNDGDDDEDDDEGVEEGNKSHEDNVDIGRTTDDKDNIRNNAGSNKAIIVEDMSEDESDVEEVERKQDPEQSAEKSPETVVVSEDSSSEAKLPSTTEVDHVEEEEGHVTDSTEDEKDARTSISKKEQRKADEEEEEDGGRSYGQSTDYSKQSMEDLEDLQEDIHKELAQITGRSLEKRKHKKRSSSSHREKRHKEKSSSRHKEQKERSSELRGNSKKDYEKRHKQRDYDIEDTRSYDSRRPKSQKGERRERSEKSSWMQTRSERSPHRASTKASKYRRDDVKESRSFKADQSLKESETKGIVNETGKSTQKGVISDSMREMIRASMKDRRPERPRDLSGFNDEIVEYESDESGEHYLGAKMSDVSSASSSDEDQDAVDSSPEVPKLPPYLPAIQGCRSVEEFQWLNRIEEGTYGVVYRAKDKRTGDIVALKKLKMEKEKEGFPITSLREINTLLKAQHPNIVTVQEIVVGSNMDKIYIVMDFVEHDLKALMETMTQSFLSGEIKTIMIQLLRAVSHLHDNWILHRDIKTSNLLLSNKGILKVGDFGLAREYGSPLKPYTPIVVTLWYRAPELLLGAKEYSTPIDLWSVGCVFAELLTMKPLFNGQSEISQINKIFKELGTPSDKIWPGPPAYSEHPATKKMTFAEHPYNNLRNRFGATLTDNGFDLLNSFLTYDPKRRITADDALKHEYFKESPSPVDPSMFPSWPARSEGAKRTKKASPKAPEGGNFYKTLSGDGDGAGFHIPVGKSKGSSAVPGFTLKF